MTSLIHCFHVNRFDFSIIMSSCGKAKAGLSMYLSMYPEIQGALSQQYATIKVLWTA